jgi:predicted aconitase with swiveling domain
MRGSGIELHGRALHPGDAEGQLLHLDTPVSFWGGVDEFGRIIDVHHAQCGESLTGKVMVMASGRGSSSSTTVLAECIRAGTAPAAIVLAECDTILVIGALVAAELYDLKMPVVQLSPLDLELLTIPGTAHVWTDPDTVDATVRVDVAP